MRTSFFTRSMSRRHVGPSRVASAACSTVECLEQRCLLSADLTGSFSGAIPASLPPGGKNNLTLHVVNQGDADATAPVGVALFASTDNVLDANDTSIPIASKSLKVKAHGNTNFKLSFASPANLADGNYFLIARIDPNSAVVDSNPANNVVATSRTISIRKPFVDLTDSVTVLTPGPLTIGGKKAPVAKVSCVVTNNGNVAAKGRLAVNLFASLDSSIDLTSTQLPSPPVRTVNIKANKSQTFTFSAKLGSNIPSGAFFVLAEVNPSGFIHESDTSNNLAVSSRQITINNPAIPPGPRLASALTVTDSTIVAGTPDLEHFHVTVIGATSSTAVEVDEVDAAGNLIGKLLDLSDNGSPLNGDGVAKDGIFSGVTSVGIATVGARYFVAKVSDSSTGAALQTPAITVTAVNAPSAAQVQADVQDYQTVSQLADNVAAAGGSATAQLDAAAAALPSDPFVVQSSIQRNSTTLFWKDTDGIEQAIDTSFVPTEAGLGSDPASSASPSAALPTPAVVHDAALVTAAAAPSVEPTVEDTTKKAIVLSPFAFQWGGADPSTSTDPGANIAAALEAKGYTVNFKTNSVQGQDNVNVPDFEQLGQYGVVVICAHGGILPDGTVRIGTGELVNSFTSSIYTGDLITGRLMMDTLPAVGRFYTIKPSFIEEHTGSMDRSIVYLNACHSTQNSTMAGAFLGAGAAAVIGFNNTVSTTFANREGLNTFDTLLQDPSKKVSDIPGINTTQDPAPKPGFFTAMGDLSATLPQPALLKNTDVYVLYTWPQTQHDLDTNTSFVGSSAGYALAGSPYLNWSGDNTGAGGSESVYVNIYQAWVDGKWTGSTTIGYGADWYTPSNGAGPAVVTIGLEDTSTLAFYAVAQTQVSPGQETSGSMTQAGVVTLLLSGDPLNPTVSIQFN